jgi:ssDNA-specific exonuclease RecJ
VHLDHDQSFLTTDAKLDSLKNFKFALKTPTYFDVKHHHQEAHYLSLAKVTIVKMS